MEGVGRGGGPAGLPGRTHPQQVVSGVRAQVQPTTLSYQSDVKRSSLLKKTRSLKRDRSERFASSEVEYYLSDKRRWTDKARISVNTARCRCRQNFVTAVIHNKLERLSLASLSSQKLTLE
jgi:hypothetical protein